MTTKTNRIPSGSPHAAGCGPFVRCLRSSRYLAFILLVWAVAPSVGAQQKPDLFQMTIEDLMKIEVTSAAKKEQTLLQIPAAVYVITQEDIRRSGVTSLPEALRLAPGVHVAQINTNSWAISIRGFNYRFADKLLVMIDGRTIYSPIFSGVFWELHDIPLEDIERIEVVRGPGGTLWGANAKNGVINIITKRAQDTQGLLIAGSVGSQHQDGGEVRFGGAHGDDLAYRVYGKYLHWGRGPDLQTSGADAYDGWDMVRGGFRLDWSPSPRDKLTFSGDLFRGNEENAYPFPTLVPPYLVNAKYDSIARGGNLLAKWSRDFSPRSSLNLRIFYDRAQRTIVPGFSPLYEVLDVDLQHRLSLGKRHELVFGGGFRSGQYHSHDTFVVRLDPSDQRLNTANGFLQDEIMLAKDRLWLVLGSKFEHNQYTGFEAQPNLRLHWQPRSKHMFWAAVSRALTTPNDFQEVGQRVSTISPGPGGLAVVALSRGNRRLKAQNLIAYEAGYRTQPNKRLALDISAFFNSYHQYVDVAPGMPYPETTPAPAHLVVPLQFVNNIIRHNYGLEFTGTYAPNSFWKLMWGYSWLVNGAFIISDPASSPFRSGDDPRHQFQVRSFFSLAHHLEWDSSLFYVSRLPPQSLPSYVRFDTRLGWRAGEHVEISVVGQNLLDPHHPEFTAPELWTQPAQVGRNAYVKFTWRF